MPFVVLLGAAAVVGFSTAPAEASQPTMHLSYQGLQSVARYVQDNGNEFAGTYLDSTHQIAYVDVSAAMAPADAQSRLAALHANTAVGAQAWTVQMRQVRYSTAQLTRIKAAVLTAQPFARMAKPDLANWWVDPKSDTVVVQLTTVTPALRAAATKAFGDRVTIEQGQRFKPADKLIKITKPLKIVKAAQNRPALPNTITPGAQPSVDDASRGLDEPPYFGGDNIITIVDINGEEFLDECTAGFSWTSTNGSVQNAAMATAGHCGEVGSTWIQGTFDPSTETITETGVMGTSFSLQWGNNRIDANLLGSGDGYAADVYRTSIDATNVNGANIVMEGSKVCGDGFVTGENCTGIVQATNIDANEPNVADGVGENIVVTGLDVAASSDDSVLTQDGDSGGPVYTIGSSGLSANGIINGDVDGSFGTEMLFTDIGSFMSVMGGVQSISAP